MPDKDQSRLAPYAVCEAQSQGRRYPEPPPAYRSEYQRDRDRVVHCSAFRRLEYKTQVFINHEGDMYRTRLTHSLEVAQLARSIARALRLNEDVTEAVALAHDLGHTPFGHAGQHALNDCMRDYGGFEHNRQSLRVVDELEDRYPDFPGLNLMFETREGILKHCSRKAAERLGGIGKRFLDGTQPSLEAQIANLADEIAYNHHDIDDGIRAGLVQFEKLMELHLYKSRYEQARRNSPKANAKTLRHTVLRRMINFFVVDLIETTQRNLDQRSPGCLADVRTAGQPIVEFSAATKDTHATLKKLLQQCLYEHQRVYTSAMNAGMVIRELFEIFMADPSRLPEDRVAGIDIPPDRARCVADYIAGMTDRYAIKAHQIHCGGEKVVFV
jgi:dGTPase